MAKLAAENIQSSQRQKQAIADWNNYKGKQGGNNYKQETAAATKQAKQASQQKTASSSTRQQRIAEIKANINAVADDKTKTPAERYPAWRKKNYLERNAQANENANLIFGRGKGNRAKRRANAIKGNNK